MSKSLYCPLMWHNMCISTKGRTKPCCHAKTIDSWKSTDFLDGINQERFNESRKLLDEGFFPEECETCKVNEEQGFVSPRLKSIRLDEYNLNEPSLKTLDVKFNNTCNLGCIMCSPESSSILESLYKNQNRNNIPLFLNDSHQKLSNFKFREEDKKKFIKKAAEDGLEELKVTGGEPFASIDFIEILNWLYNNGYSKNMTLSITTNGTKFNKNLIKILSTFKRLKINISLDGTGKVYDYIRKGSNWDKIYHNLTMFSDFKKNNPQIFNKHGSHISLTFVLQFANIMNIKDFALVSDHLNFDFYIDINLRPLDSELSAKFAPKNVKEIAIKDCQSLYKTLTKLTHIGEIDKVIEYLESIYDVLDLNKQKKLRSTIDIVDNIHSCDFQEYLHKEQIKFLKEIKNV